MLGFMGIIIGIGFRTRIVIGLLIMFIHPVGGAEPIVGVLPETERYGGQIIQEIEEDYPTLTLHKSLRAK